MKIETLSNNRSWEHNYRWIWPIPIMYKNNKGYTLFTTSILKVLVYRWLFNYPYKL